MDKLARGAAKLGLRLSSRQLEQFVIFYQELVEWNQRINLTAITDYDEVQVKHFLDSLTVFLARQERFGSGRRLIDVGAGAGLPGVPLKIVFPEIKLVLLDATAKKTDFLRHLVGELRLDDVDIIAGRAEEVARLTSYREQFDLVLSRAVAPLPTLVELTLPFCVVGGSFIAQKKGDIRAEVDMAAGAINLLGGKLREITSVELEELADDRWLIVIDKISTTPARYPRRTGVPSKRPLLDKRA